MRVVKKGYKKHKEEVYQFDCRHCDSTLKAHESELRPHGFNKRIDIYVYYCPVCGCNRTVRPENLAIVEGLTW